MSKDRRRGSDRRRASPTEDNLRLIVAGIGIVLFLMILIIYKFNL
jgi:Na+-transporting methylmalonyl-CoA/oxaloacetate decarboxylase gamma subunit